MATVEWAGASRSDKGNDQAESGRLVNLYRENLDGKLVLRAVPGTVQFADIGASFMRALKEVGGDIYAAVGGQFYRVRADGEATSLGPISSGEMTTISSNNGKVTVAADGDYYVFDGATRTTPTTGDVLDVGSVSFLGQRTVITERNGRRVQWSELVDPDTFVADNFATAEQRDDSILRGEAIGAAYWIFKEHSTEVWYPTGTDTFIAYQDMFEIGLKAFGLFCAIPDGAFFIGTDNVAYLVGDGQRKIVSVRAVETAIAEGTATRCFYYEAKGHKFCVLRFPDRPAWVYDIAMNEWHERAEGFPLGHWTAVDAVNAFGSFFVGGETGAISRLDNVSVDASGPLIRRAVSQALIVKGQYFTIDELEFWGTIGQSNVVRPVEQLMSDDDRFILLDVDDEALLVAVEAVAFDGARIALRLSRDRGRTFGKYRVRSLGNLGDYGRVVKFRALGVCRSACVEITIADDAPVALDAQAELNIS